MNKFTNHYPAVGTCPFCASDDVDAVSFECTIPSGRKKRVVSELQKSECRECGENFVSEIQHAFNVGLIDLAGKEQQAFVTQGLIRKFRERFGLTQRLASKLFGAGDSAVGKWEAGQLPSGPAALLVQTAIHVPGAAQYLASLAQISFTESHEGLKWQSSTTSIKEAQSRYGSIVAATRERERERAVPLFCAEADYTIDELYGCAA